MSNETALAVVPSETQQPQDISMTWTQDDLKALQETVAKGCNGPQFKVFVAACKRLQLDPFARQIVPIVQSGGMTPQVTIDGFRLIAERTRRYLGQVGPFWCGPDGKWHEVWLENEPPTACKVGVIRDGFREIMWGVARTRAYAKGNLWNTMPDVMIAKVAESLALRKAFPNELSGVYTREEMRQALAEDQDDDAPYVESAPQPKPVPQPPTPIQRPQSSPPWQTLRRQALSLGYSTQDDWERFVVTTTGKSDPKSYTEADRRQVAEAIKRLQDGPRVVEEAAPDFSPPEDAPLHFPEGDIEHDLRGLPVHSA
jgi:phage recombination protein Bet